MGILDGLWSDSGSGLGGTPQQGLDPRLLGILGAIQAAGAANPPQAASRLPLAQPSSAYVLSQALGGFGKGYGTGLEQQNEAAKLPYVQAQTAGSNLTNLTNLQNYNLIAPHFGQPTLTMKDLQKGNFDQKTMQVAASQAGGQQQPAQPGGMGGILGWLGNALGGSQPQQPQTPPQPAPQAQPIASAPGGAPLAPPVPGPAAAPPATPPMATPPSSGLGGTQAMPAPSGQSSDPVVQRRLNQVLYGTDLTPLQKIIVSNLGDPYDPQYKPLIQNEMIKGAGLDPVIGGQRPGIPAQSYDPASGTYKVMPGQFETMTRGAMTQVPAKEAAAAFEAGLKINTENEIEKRKAFYQTGVQPPDYGAPQNNGPAPVSAKGDIATPQGTVVPAPPKSNVFRGTDAITKENANTQETEKNLGAIQQGLPGTESRMVGLARALQVVESKGLNEGRAEIANNLRGAGMESLANLVMSAKDQNAVQTAIGLQTLDVLGQLKQINSGTGGRILNSEFVNLLEKQYGPNLGPTANYELLKQALGGIYQTQNMIRDYFQVAKPAGWRDANGFMSAYYSDPHNSMDAMMQQAAKVMGPLKGMPGVAQQGGATAKADPLGIR